MNMIKFPRELSVITVAFLLIVIVKIAISFYFAGPQSLPDATEYDYMAQSILDGTFMESVPSGDHFPPGYSFLISLAYLFGTDKVLIYHTQLIINAIIAALIIFPSYFILRDWCSKEIAICGSIIVATLPAISAYTGLLMSENLFLPLTVFALYFIYRSFSEDNEGYLFSVLAGLSIFYLVFTRFTGLAMVIALIVGFMVHLYLQKKSGKNARTALQYTWPALACCFIPLIIWRLFISINKNTLLPFTGTDSMISNTLETATTNFFEVVRVVVLQVDYVLLSSYIVFAVLAMYAMATLLSRPSHIKEYLPNKCKSRSDSLCIMAVITPTLIFLLALLPMPNLIANHPYLHGRYFDPIIPLVFIFGIIGLQAIANQPSTIKNRSSILLIGASILVSICTLTLFSWNTHFDALQNVSLLYLFQFESFIAILIIVGMFGILFPIIVTMCKHIQIMRLFLSMIILLNCMIAVPLYQTEIQFSNNFDNVGVIGKVIQYNIDPEAVIIWDSSSLESPWNVFMYALIDYWIVNDFRSIHLANTASSGDYSALEGGDYIITALAGSTEPLYISPSGLALYSLR